MAIDVNVIIDAIKNLGGRARARDISPEVARIMNIEPEDEYKDYTSFYGTVQAKIESFCPESENYLEGNKKLFSRVGHGIYELYNKNVLKTENDILLPEEIETPEKYEEGSTKLISVNFYERNPQAREDCIGHYGYNCSVCDFNFKEVYGEIGIEFIHVHHLCPLAEIGEKYIINPIKDLRPVCPNCHAMLHRYKNLLSINELKKILKKFK